jgi:hypothetical protein
MKAEDFGALETAKLLNGPFNTPHCSLRGMLYMKFGLILTLPMYNLAHNSRWNPLSEHRMVRLLEPN